MKNSSDNISFNETERKKSLNHCNETPVPYFQKKDQENHKVNGREINTGNFLICLFKSYVLRLKVREFLLKIMHSFNSWRGN